jgi:hypothetical protein
MAHPNGLILAMTETPDAHPVFSATHELLLPLLNAHRFRLGGMEHEGGNSYAEYWRPGLRLRLVWEGTEQALWVDAAPENAAQVIGRWQDIEWQLAGQQLPLERDLTESRVVALVRAVTRYLESKKGK